jgi:uncharacterized protein
MILDSQIILLLVLIFLSALLYSSVGHAGASGYLAAMALVGLAPATMRPTALVLNVLVALIATYKYYRVGAFSKSLFWPLVVTSIPCALLGGYISLPNQLYKPIVGLVLIYASWFSFKSALVVTEHTVRVAPKVGLLLTGAVLGLLSGLTGVGGGIFLSPLLLALKWAPTRTISGVSAAFILVNSIAGLIGAASRGIALESSIVVFGLAAMVGGVIGAEYGSKRLANAWIKRLLALVLLIAGVKMIASA